MQVLDLIFKTKSSRNGRINHSPIRKNSMLAVLNERPESRVRHRRMGRLLWLLADIMRINKRSTHLGPIGVVPILQAAYATDAVVVDLFFIHLSDDAMTALQALSSALLSLHNNDPPSPPSSDEFQFESEYVKSLLKQRTPSPIVIKPSIANTNQPLLQEKENIDQRWKTPVTLGPQVGRTILAQRDLNRTSISGIGENTPAVKLSSYTCVRV
jgi:hypothetical protein